MNKDYLKFKKSLPEEYLLLQEKYEKIYGKEKTIVLMQVGSFHEAYATDKRGFNLHKLADLLNIIVSKKNKKIQETSIKNPYMLGFPIVSTNKFLNILVDNGFTVIKIDQVTEPPKPHRAITGIYSPGTNIDNMIKPESNNILSIFIEEEKQGANQYLFASGISMIDLSTGKSVINEVYSTKSDINYALDEVIKFINYHLPKEVIITLNNIQSMEEKNLIKYLELEDKNYNIIKLDKDIVKINYQQEFFEKVYSNKTNMNIIEYLDLEMINYGRLSFINLLSYCQDHVKNIINNIKLPEIYDSDKNLFLGNNALIQLNVLSDNMSAGFNCKYKSLFNVLDQTNTSMGKRYLKEQLINPILDIKVLEYRYKSIESLSKNKLYDSVKLILREILDLERLSRKMELSKLNPFEFINIDEGNQSLKKIITLFKKNKLYKHFFESDFEKHLDEYIKFYSNLFNFDIMKSISFIDCEESFYNKGIYEDVDKIQKKIDDVKYICENIEKVISDLVDDKKQKYFKEGNNKKLFVNLNSTDKEGLFLLVTKRRCEQIKKKLQKKSIQINDTEIKFEDFEFKNNSTNTKIFIKQLSSSSDKILVLKKKMKSILLEKYKEDCKNISSKFKDIINNLIEKISFIDFINSGTKVSIKNKYCMPKIDRKYKKSYVNCKNLRHPIIEKISDFAYIPHTLELGKDLKGMLLFGLNSSGKSSLMKAIGLSIIIAQIGYFVPASDYTFYPYKSLFTRISGNDNLFKGLSSYALEINELKAILKRCNDSTLIIADEVCKGTEHNSALIIVITMIEMLIKAKSTFITATHLHELTKFKRLKNIDKVKCFHLHVEYDEKNNKLIYDRKLREGNGKTEYGLDVAKCIMNDDEFIDLANIIKKEYENENKIINNKTSNYNSQVFMNECGMCKNKEDLETHHIEFQMNTDINGFIKTEGKEHVHKNHKSNLIVLCEKCHDKIHNNKLNIKGYIETNFGKEIID